MIRHFIFAPAVLFVLLSCNSSGRKPRQPRHFGTIEISYYSGWGKSFTLQADSTGEFISPWQIDTLKYGSLTQALKWQLDSLTDRLLQDSSIHSINEPCDDCSNLALIIRSLNDSVSITQLGKIQPLFYPVIDSIFCFLDSLPHSVVKEYRTFITSDKAGPPPPPPVHPDM